MLGLARWAGLRAEEALELPWRMVDLERRRITITARDDWRPKDGDARTVPIGPELYDLLREARDRDPAAKWVIPRGSIPHQEHLAGLRADLPACGRGPVRQADALAPQELHHGLGGGPPGPCGPGVGGALGLPDDDPVLPEGVGGGFRPGGRPGPKSGPKPRIRPLESS